MHDPKAVMRSLPLVASVLGRKYGVKVEIGGNAAFTDGKAIHLPSLPLDAPEILINLARGYIDHESAHLRETDFEALKVASLTPLEMHIWNTIEDWRVENKLAALFPGCRQNFTWLIEHLFGGEGAAVAVSNPALHILNWLLLTVRSWDVPSLDLKRDSMAISVDTHFPGLRVRMESILNSVRTRCRSTEDALEYARNLASLLAQTSVPETQMTKQGGSDQSEDSDQEDQSNKDSDQTPCPAGDSCSQDSSDQDDVGMGSAEPSSDDPTTAESVGSDGEGVSLRPLPEEARKGLQELLSMDADSLPKEMGSILAEALGQMAHGDQDECLAVAIPRPKPSRPLPADELMEVRHASVALRTQLHGLLQTKTLARSHTGRKGRLDTCSLHRSVTADLRVFRRKGERQGIDTAAHILLDCSSSMAQRIQLASKACYAVAKALRSCSINVGLTAFPAAFVPDDQGGRGSWATVGQIIKHGERVHERVLVNAAGSTPMGEALWWVLQDMLPLPEKRKLILILTDGEPDSVPSMLDATKQATRLGMEVYGIGIGATSIESLLPGRSQSIHSLGELAPAMFEMLQGALIRR